MQARSHVPVKKTMFILVCQYNTDGVITYAAAITASSSPAQPGTTVFYGSNPRWQRQARLWIEDEAVGWPQASPQAFVCHVVSLRHRAPLRGMKGSVCLLLSLQRGWNGFRLEWDGRGWWNIWTSPLNSTWKAEIQSTTTWLVTGVQSNHVMWNDDNRRAGFQRIIHAQKPHGSML